MATPIPSTVRAPRERSCRASAPGGAAESGACPRFRRARRDSATASAPPVRQHRLHLAAPPRRPPRRRAEVQRRPAARDDRPGEVDQDHRQLVAVQVQPHRVPGVRDQPQHRARLAARGGAAAGLRRQALRPQPGGDLADGLRREPRPLRQLEAADARARPPTRSRSSTSAALWLRSAADSAPRS